MGGESNTGQHKQKGNSMTQWKFALLFTVAMMLDGCCRESVAGRAIRPDELSYFGEGVPEDARFAAGVLQMRADIQASLVEWASEQKCAECPTCVRNSRLLKAARAKGVKGPIFLNAEALQEPSHATDLQHRRSDAGRRSLARSERDGRRDQGRSRRILSIERSHPLLRLECELDGNCLQDEAAPQK